jgi:hypothetical protein
MMVEASSPVEARRIILADLEIDPGSYYDNLEPVSERIGEMKVTIPERRAPMTPRSFPCPWRAEPSDGGNFATLLGGAPLWWLMDTAVLIEVQF